MEILFLFVLILLLSVLFSFLGMGGAIIYIPLLYWLGTDLLVAITIGLMLNVVTSASASITYLRKKTVDLLTAAPFIVSSVAAAPVGTYISLSMSEDTILHIFSMVLVIEGVIMFFSRNASLSQTTKFSDRNKVVIGVLLGIIIGMASGILGIGGGIFLVPALILLGFGARKAPATSAIVVLFSSLSGFLSHVGAISIDFSILLVFAIAAVSGAQVGSRLMYLRSDRFREIFEGNFSKVFGLLLIMISMMVQYSVMFGE